MSFFLQAIILGLIQGVAEFLPISSSGHLSIAQNAFGLANADADHLFFDVLLHLGTLVAVFVAYWGEIRDIVLEFLSMIRLRRRPEGQKPDRLSQRMIGFLIVATLPLVLVFLFKDQVESLMSNLIFIGTMLLVTGLLLFLSDRMNRGTKDLKSASVLDIVVVGLSQVIAVVPGLSRSGTTISAGLSRGFSREFAVKFSFLMSIPAIIGANLLSVVDAVQAGIDWSLMPAYLVGVVVAAVSGYFSIIFLKKITRSKGFGLFSYYCWGAGLVTIVLGLF